MARLSDLPFKHRLFLKAYRFRRLDPVPWTRVEKPLAECRVGLVTTAAFYLPGMEPFDEGRKGGDTSYRVIPLRETDGSLSRTLQHLQIGHRSTAFDPAGIRKDYNLALPAARLLELEAQGTVGALHPEALSFMGSITAPGRLVKASAPEAGARFQEAGVDIALLCPV